MAFVIQDINSGKYLKHDGTTNDHPYDDVNTAEEAEQFPKYEHACYAAFWYADMSRKWRVIDLETGERFVHNRGGRYKPERKLELLSHESCNRPQ